MLRCLIQTTGMDGSDENLELGNSVKVRWCWMGMMVGWVKRVTKYWWLGY
jgi:hypothetical protein